MGGRGAGRGGGGVVGGGSFEKNAENVIQTYRIDFVGNKFIFGKKPTASDERWINANKERILNLKAKVDKENKEVQSRYKQIKDNIIVEAFEERGKTGYIIKKPILTKEGLRLKIKTDIEDELEHRGRKITAKELWNTLAKTVGGQKIMISQKDLDKFL